MAASHRQLPVAVKLAAINDHLVCHLCGGYIMEATAVVECLHAFCRSCIVKHVKKPGEKHRCPVCNILIREAQPLAGLRLDRTLQDIIEKLLPQTHEDEEQKEELFNATRNVNTGPLASRTKTTSSKSSPVERPLPPSTEEKVSVFIKPSRSWKGDSSVEGAGCFQKYLRCSARMTVLHLKRFIVEKTGWDHTLTDQVDILCKGHMLRDELTLEFIWRIRWGNARSMLVLEYARKETEDTAAYSSKTSRKRKGRRRVTRGECEGEGDLENHGGDSNNKHSAKRMVIPDSSSSSSEQPDWAGDLDAEENDVKSLEGEEEELLTTGAQDIHKPEITDV